MMVMMKSLQNFRNVPKCDGKATRRGKRRRTMIRTVILLKKEENEEGRV